MCDKWKMKAKSTTPGGGGGGEQKENVCVFFGQRISSAEQVKPFDLEFLGSRRRKSRTGRESDKAVLLLKVLRRSFIVHVAQKFSESTHSLCKPDKESSFFGGALAVGGACDCVNKRIKTFRI